jgi:hypothetical protein
MVDKEIHEVYRILDKTNNCYESGWGNKTGMYLNKPAAKGYMSTLVKRKKGHDYEIVTFTLTKVV